MQQVGCCMVAGNIVFAPAFNFKLNFVANGNSAFGYGANHNGCAVRQFFGNFNLHYAGRGNNAAGIAKLSARDIMGYLVIVTLFVGVVACLGFLAWAAWF